MKAYIMKNKMKFLWKVLFVALINLLIISMVYFAGTADAVTKIGSQGEEVRTIQDKLKRWGYYRGEVDGIFGEETRRAVMEFQEINGLTADGQVGSATLAALGMGGSNIGSSNSNGYGGFTKTELDLLAKIISAEARGEPYEGQVAVGAVVMNRMAHPSFPGTLSGVIYQNGAFSCLYDGQFDQPVAESAYRAARDAMNGWDPSYGAIYDFNPVTATSKWIWSRPLIVTIGRHRFCA